MTSKKVRVAIIGVGNCASSLVQGVEFYKNAKDNENILKNGEKKIQTI